MANMMKFYSGSITNEEDAARVYDKYSIKTLGLRAKTNYDYTRKELIEILKECEVADGAMSQGISFMIHGSKIVLNPGKKISK